MTHRFPTDIMARAYLEAAVFTDCGDLDQPPSDAEFSDIAKCQAFGICQAFYFANDDLLNGNYVQAGHDIWLTRNGYGTGFWDRPEIWGKNKDILDRCAKTLGTHELYQGDDGLLYFS